MSQPYPLLKSEWARACLGKTSSLGHHILVLEASASLGNMRPPSGMEKENLPNISLRADELPAPGQYGMAIMRLHGIISFLPLILFFILPHFDSLSSTISSTVAGITG
ncbi:unnamed protein product [Protopolystoma xenopodis]|uniref:Uncharacterized protein n=1 Tax=Protopolystoma xenopodis TaxID=117903 RepID=A0A3S5ALU7_9PLAT|nr:unnamed protein product [Protopolystoma xenopodis]